MYILPNGLFGPPPQGPKHDWFPDNENSQHLDLIVADPAARFHHVEERNFEERISIKKAYSSTINTILADD